MNADARLEAIREALSANRYSEHDFWDACPFTESELCSSSRYTEVRSWRQAGMVWMRLCGHPMKYVGDIFSRNHTTVLHAEVEAARVLKDKRQGCRFLLEHLTDVSDYTHLWVKKHDDVCVNEGISLVLLENQIAKLISPNREGMITE
jgi:hypothetical protein